MGSTVDNWSELTQELAAAARTLQAEGDIQQMLDRAIALAVDLIDGCDYAGASIVHRKKPIDTPAASDQLVLRGHELQYTLQEGPCLDAIWEQETVHSPDLAADGRWPRWGPQVIEQLGIRSMLSFRLYTSAETLGAYNLYSHQMDAFDEDDINARPDAGGPGCCGPRGNPAGRSTTNRGTDPDHHRPAQRNLMERFSLTADRAFVVLRRVSQNRNVKIHEVASHPVVTRVLPAAAPEDLGD